MSNLSGFLNPSAEIPTGTGALPAGWYLSVIVESELRDNYNKDGQEYSLTYEVMEGHYKGRKFWHTIAKTGPDASRIGKGQGEMNAIIHATGVTDAKDTHDFHYKPHMVRLSFVAAGTVSGSGNAYQKDKNFLNEWKKADNSAHSTAHGSAGPSPFAAKPEQTNANGAPGWAQKAA